jgi:hypothetical protein
MRLVGKATRPPAGAWVVCEPRFDLVDEPCTGQDRMPTPAELAHRGECQGTPVPDVRALGARFGRRARRSRRPHPAYGPDRRDKSVHLDRGIGRTTVELRPRAQYRTLVPYTASKRTWPN